MFLAIDMTDIQDSEEASNAIYLEVIVGGINTDEVKGIDVFKEEEMQTIINSIKLEKLD